jgi:hypothetical protein
MGRLECLFESNDSDAPARGRPGNISQRSCLIRTHEFGCEEKKERAANARAPSPCVQGCFFSISADQRHLPDGQETIREKTHVDGYE